MSETWVDDLKRLREVLNVSGHTTIGETLRLATSKLWDYRKHVCPPENIKH
jgi:hypothetical protein